MAYREFVRLQINYEFVSDFATFESRNSGHIKLHDGCPLDRYSFNKADALLKQLYHGQDVCDIELTCTNWAAPRWVKGRITRYDVAFRFDMGDDNPYIDGLDIEPMPV